MHGNARKEILAAVLLLLAGFLIRLALSSRTAPTGDSLRFLSQAEDLAAGSAFLVPGDLFSAVPPGYPLFLRAAGWMRPGVEFLLRVQLLLSVLTLLLVWLAARRLSRTGALVALALLAFNPWLARQQALVMSETLGAFLVGVTVLLWPAPGRPLSPLLGFRPRRAGRGIIARGTGSRLRGRSRSGGSRLAEPPPRRRGGPDRGRNDPGPRSLADLPLEKDRPRGAVSPPPHTLSKNGAPALAPDLVHHAR